MKLLITFLLLAAGISQCEAQEDVGNVYDQAVAYMSRHSGIGTVFKSRACQQAIGKKAVLRTYDSLVYIGFCSEFLRLIVRENPRTAHMSRHQQDSLIIVLRD